MIALFNYTRFHAVHFSTFATYVCSGFVIIFLKGSSLTVFLKIKNIFRKRKYNSVICILRVTGSQASAVLAVYACILIVSPFFSEQICG